MLGLAGLVLLLGYQNLYFGLAQIAGNTDGYFDYLIPGRYKGAGSSSSSSSSATTPSGLTPAQAAFLHAPTGAMTKPATTTTGKAPQSGGLGVPGVTGR